MKREGSILVVLVLYQVRLEESSSYQTLVKYRSSFSLPHEVLVYNNTPEIEVPTDSLPEGFRVFNSSKNDRLIGAYKYAMEVAEQEGFDWLMLLDSDSELTAEYFEAISVQLPKTDKKVASLLPIMEDDGRYISPTKHRVTSGPFWSVSPYTGDLPEGSYINGINSCSLVRTESIESIGGFWDQLPLDYLDCWVYYQFYCFGWKVDILPVKLQHHLSVFSLDEMGTDRYTEYMDSCARFSHINKRFSFYFKLRTALRCVKYLLLPSRWRFLKPMVLSIFK